MYMASTNEEDTILAFVLYIYYLVCFKKNNNNIKALINFNNKISIITFTIFQN